MGKLVASLYFCNNSSAASKAGAMETHVLVLDVPDRFLKHNHHEQEIRSRVPWNEQAN